MTKQEAAKIITVILDCCKGKEEDYEEHEIIPLEKSFKALGMAIEALEQEPIIHCKDCKYWHEWENGAGSCHRSSIMWVGTDCDDYCSLAEGR